MTDAKDDALDPPRNRIDIFIDDDAEPRLSTTPPLNFELDTTSLDDGPHVMRIEAYDNLGVKGVRTIPFRVRNGPGIAVSGIRRNDVLDGKIPVIVNAYGGVTAEWEPAQAETPAPVATWAWVMLICFAAFGLFYGVRQWHPSPDFARTPTYGSFTPSDGPVAAAAAAATPALATVSAGGASAPGAAPSSSAGAAGTAAPSSGTRPAALTPAEAARGESLFSTNCAACHRPDGKGLPAVFPPLAGDPVVNAADPEKHIHTVLNGKQGEAIGGVTYASPMPAFKSALSDADIAAIVNHERTSWGNAAPLVTAADVAAARE
ncbi:MAG TPA: cytochrome c [Vicinamibacterales bacterium]|nr:cytochrome c [Vicinamibacterales bacterium]